MNGKMATINSLRQRVRVYDNGGESFDRYTVIIGTAVYGMSSNPTSPQGFNQYCSEANQICFENVGARVRDLKTLPYPVLLAIQERLEG